MGILNNEPCYRIASGGAAGLTEILLFHPLDVVKTRLQSQTKGSAGAYNGIADCVRTTIRNEGFPALYKGILPPICAETPKRAIKFFCFGSYNAYLSRNTGMSNAMCGSIAGMGSGLTEGLFITPFERVKILLQNSKGSLKETPSAAAQMRSVIQQHGFGTKGGLMTGCTATLGRHGVWNMIYFGLFRTVMPIIVPDQTAISKTELNAKRFFLGCLCGTLASCINIPYDVAKSRIQSLGGLPGGKFHAMGVHKVMSQIAKTEGTAALFAGLAAKLLRLCPAGGVMMMMNEVVYDYLTTTWPLH